MILLLALLTVALVVVAVHQRAEPTVTAADLAEPLPKPKPPVVLVIGDSYVAGSAMNSGPTWPRLMGGSRGWVSVQDGIGGTGYISGETDQHAFTQRVADDCQRYLPDVIVLAGGINDAGKYPDAKVAAQAADVVDGFRKCRPNAQIVMLSPFSPATMTPPNASLNNALKVEAASLGLPYLDVGHLLEGHPELVGADLVHPTDQGHAMLAQEIGDMLAPYVPAESSAA